MPTKIKVLLDGQPLVGATLLLGEIGGQLKTTDADGVVAFPAITPPWQGYTEVLITSPVFASAKVVITANETTEVDLGESVEVP